MNENINTRIDRAMESLDGISAAEPKPFLLTRVNSALQRNVLSGKWSAIAAFLRRPAVAAGMIFLLLLLNIAILNAGNFTSQKDTAKRTAVTKYDFAINVSGIYDTENNEP